MCSIGVFFFFFSLNNTKYCLLSLLSSSLFSLSQPYSPISPHFSSYRSYFALCVHNCAGCVLFLRVLNVFFLHNSVSYFFFFNSANMTASIFFVSTLLFGGFQSFFFFWHYKMLLEFCTQNLIYSIGDIALILAIWMECVAGWEVGVAGMRLREEISRSILSRDAGLKR